MDKYVIDSNSLIYLGRFFPSRFPTLWTHIDEMALTGRLFSARECRQELDSYNEKDFLKEWAKKNSHIFLPASEAEAKVVSDILRVQHFRQLISATAQLKGKPVADPFLVASAKVNEAILVTEEILKPNAAKIPNVCQHFSVQYMNLEQFMTAENLMF